MLSNSPHRNEWRVIKWPWILCLCLSREVIVLLLLSCCDGINDQDKTIILLPLFNTSHLPEKRVYCPSNRETIVVIISILSLHNSRRLWGNEKNGLSALFYGNVRVRTIFFYYLDIIRAAPHSSTRSRELSSVLQLSLIIIYLDKHRVSVRRSEQRKEERKPLALNGLSTRDENTSSIIVEKTSAFWKYFPKFVCVLRAILSCSVLRPN